MIKWGIMATGTIAEKFAKTLNDMNDNENILTAVASRSTDKAKNFAEADRIRDALKEMGVEIIDTPQGTKWRKV